MASRGINKCIIVGNLGKDPETRYQQSGGAVTNITVATSETWKDKQTGQPQERTEWHRVVFFNRLAEIAGEYLKKGSKVYIEGSLRTRKWTNKDGVDMYTTEIVAAEMQMLDSRQGSDAGSSGTGGYGNNGSDESGYNQQSSTPPPQPQNTAQQATGQRSNPPANQNRQSTSPAGDDDFDDD